MYAIRSYYDWEIEAIRLRNRVREQDTELIKLREQVRAVNQELVDGPQPGMTARDYQDWLFSVLPVITSYSIHYTKLYDRF